MPELPELEALARGLAAATTGRRIVGVAVWQPATVKTAVPPLEALVGGTIDGIWRRGKFLGIRVGDLTALVHLMQSGRLALTARSESRPNRAASLALRLDHGRELRLREAATEHRASLHVLDASALAAHPPLVALGPEPIGLPPERWRERLAAPAARLHVAIRDGRRVAGIGRAYANDILWAARLAPFARTDRLSEADWAALARAADIVLGQAVDRALATITTDLPTREGRVTVAHGHAGEPCLRCGRTLERVSYEGFELVYCPTCQTGGRVYADRRTSRFLR